MERTMHLEQDSLSIANNKLADIMNQWIRIKQG